MVEQKYTFPPISFSTMFFEESLLFFNQTMRRSISPDIKNLPKEKKTPNDIILIVGLKNDDFAKNTVEKCSGWMNDTKTGWKNCLICHGIK